MMLVDVFLFSFSLSLTCWGTCIQPLTRTARAAACASVWKPFFLAAELMDAVLPITGSGWGGGGGDQISMDMGLT